MLTTRLNVTFFGDDGLTEDYRPCFKSRCTEVRGHAFCIQIRLLVILTTLSANLDKCVCADLLNAMRPCGYCRVRKALKESGYKWKNT